LLPSVTTLCDCGFDILGCGNKTAAQLHWFRDPLTVRLASAQRRLEQFSYDLFEFLALMDSVNLDFAHEFVREDRALFSFRHISKLVFCQSRHRLRNRLVGEMLDPRPAIRVREGARLDKSFRALPPDENENANTLRVNVSRPISSRPTQRQPAVTI
jgi:hypothetical protein